MILHRSVHSPNPCDEPSPLAAQFRMIDAHRRLDSGADLLLSVFHFIFRNKILFPKFV